MAPALSLGIPPSVDGICLDWLLFIHVFRIFQSGLFSGWRGIEGRLPPQRRECLAWLRLLQPWLALAIIAVVDLRRFGAVLSCDRGVD